jgi:hypothetical protein
LANTKSNPPDFAVIGAAKSGTTSLYHYLGRHPDIYLSAERKEGRHFSALVSGGFHWPQGYSFETTEDVREYQALFEAASGEAQLRGDISPDYLGHAERAAPRLYQEAGDIPVIALLRNPVERAYSHYLQNVRRRAEPYSFKRALEVEASRKASGWTFQWLYRATGDYLARLQPYWDHFSRLLVLPYEQFGRQPEDSVAAILAFLGLEDEVQSDFGKRYNVGGIPSALLPVVEGAFDDQPLDREPETVFACLQPDAVGDTTGAPKGDGVYPPLDDEDRVYPAMPEDLRETLEAEMRSSLEELERHTGVDLASWWVRDEKA